MRVEGRRYRIAADQVGGHRGGTVAAGNVHIVAYFGEKEHWILLEFALLAELLLQLLLLLGRGFRHVRAGFD